MIALMSMSSWGEDVGVIGVTEILKGEGPVFRVCRGKSTAERSVIVTVSVSDQAFITSRAPFRWCPRFASNQA